MIDPYPEIEFRDGVRVVLPHVAALLNTIETWKFTYDEAVKIANNQLLRDRLNEAQRDAFTSHFRRFG